MRSYVRAPTPEQGTLGGIHEVTTRLRMTRYARPVSFDDMPMLLAAASRREPATIAKQ